MTRVLVLALALLGSVPSPLDSQIVLDRYALALATFAPPKAMIFTYSVSQAGPTDLEQRHEVYRSGLRVRDETIAVNGSSVHRKIVRIARRADPYAVTALAPRSDAYELLFSNAVRDGKHVDYVYDAQPIARSESGFVVDRVTIDGESFLPRTIAFHTAGALASGKGSVTFASVGGYWVPVLATVNAVVNGTKARERIVFFDYRFPAALPRSTFL